MGQSDFDHANCGRLTAKQREVLQLVVQRKSSKEIARLLGIAKPTVDQRIVNARQILGARDRDEAALIFAQDAQTYDRITYDPARVPSAAVFADSRRQEARQASEMVLEEAAIPFSGVLEYTSAKMPGLPWSPSGDLGTGNRLLIIVGLTVGMLVTILIGLSVAQSLSGLLTAP